MSGEPHFFFKVSGVNVRFEKRKGQILKSETSISLYFYSTEPVAFTILNQTSWQHFPIVLKLGIFIFIKLYMTLFIYFFKIVYDFKQTHKKAAEDKKKQTVHLSSQEDNKQKSIWIFI